MTTSNKAIGNKFEETFARLLQAEGFWVHKFQQNASGQPADVIAIKEKEPYLIDCKVCTGDKFVLSRVEVNQHLAMDLWRDCGNGEPWFAILIREKVFMIPHYTMKTLIAKEVKSIDYMEIKKYGTAYEKWVNKC